jgi:hypothetical protein
VSYQRLSSQFQFSLSAASLGMSLSGWQGLQCVNKDFDHGGHRLQRIGIFSESFTPTGMLAGPGGDRRDQRVLGHQEQEQRARRQRRAHGLRRNSGIPTGRGGRQMNSSGSRQINSSGSRQGNSSGSRIQNSSDLL